MMHLRCKLTTKTNATLLYGDSIALLARLQAVATISNKLFSLTRVKPDGLASNPASKSGPVRLLWRITFSDHYSLVSSFLL